MHRILAVICLVLGPTLAKAQDNLPDSLFASYDAYAEFVDKMVSSRQFVPFIQKMGGRDEYTAEQLGEIEQKLTSIFPSNFTSRTVFREESLGGAIRQEGRAYWNGARYLFYYAVLHERGDALVVLNFSLNTKIEVIMNRF